MFFGRPWLCGATFGKHCLHPAHLTRVIQAFLWAATNYGSLCSFAGKVGSETLAHVLDFLTLSYEHGQGMGNRRV